MLKEPVTVLVQAVVAGPNGLKLKPGQIVTLDDSHYVRILVKSGAVSLIDPPSLDPEYLEKAGYELKEGHSYPVKAEPLNEENTVDPIKEERLEGFLTRTPKKEIKPKEPEVQGSHVPKTPSFEPSVSEPPSTNISTGTRKRVPKKKEAPTENGADLN